jgi:hypothetical protein
MTFAKVILRSGEKPYVAFEDEATETVAKCNLPSVVMCTKKDIEKLHNIHFWYYGDRTIKQIEENPIANV